MGVESLPIGWRLAELDRFEGEGYRRILVPVFAKEMSSAQEAGERRLYTLANLYAPAEASPDAAAS